MLYPLHLHPTIPDDVFDARNGIEQMEAAERGFKAALEFDKVAPFPDDLVELSKFIETLYWDFAVANNMHVTPSVREHIKAVIGGAYSIGRCRKECRVDPVTKKVVLGGGRNNGLQLRPLNS